MELTINISTTIKSWISIYKLSLYSVAMLNLFKPTIAFAHDPRGWGIASLFSIPICVVLGYFIVKYIWRLDHKLTANKSKAVKYYCFFNNFLDFYCPFYFFSSLLFLL